METIAIQWTCQLSGKQILFPLTAGESVRLGRAPADGIQVDGDLLISREHADVEPESDGVFVRCLETARNSIMFDGSLHRETFVPAGECFQIGLTVFHVTELEGDSGDDNVLATIEQSYSPGELGRAEFSDARQQLEILASLPQLISSTKTDEELALIIAKLLLDGMPEAEAVAVVQYDRELISLAAAVTETLPAPRLMKVHTRDSFNGRFQPSRRLMIKSLRNQCSVLNIWSQGAGMEFTMTEGLGWAFACPVRGEGSIGWCLYVSGVGSRKSKMFFTEEDLRGDLRFTELLTDFVSSIRQVRFLQEQRTQLSSFFSPTVIENLTASGDRPSLEPAERDVTVLFCDLRGFSKRSESLQHDLLTLLKGVSEALGVMADGVLGLDGAIADFQGDAILGFWGWPLSQQTGALPACRAALRIEAEFLRANKQAHKLLSGLTCGIGVAHGRALAGKIGTDKQSKIGVFGPVVNQGSRLEGLTKQFGVSICIDEKSADFVRRSMPPQEGRLRRLARVRPKGMDTPIDVFSLLPSIEKLPEVTDEMIQQTDELVQAIIDGNWKKAKDLHEGLPGHDGPARFYRQLFDKYGTSPPANWDGIIRLDSK